MYVVVLYNLRCKGTKNFFISAVILIKSIVYKPYAIEDFPKVHGLPDGHHDHELHGLRALLEKGLVSTRMPVFCLSS